MSMQDLGSLGEMVGAIAVLATLIYLAVQTKQTRLAAEQTAKFAASEATHSAEGGYARWRMSISGNTDVAKIMAKARTETQLEDFEQIIFSAVFDQLFFTSAVSYLSGSGDASVHTSSADVDHTVEDLIANPHAKRDWQRCRSRLNKVSSTFVTAVENSLPGSQDDT